MLSLTTPIPRPLALYPRADPTERVALHQWLKSLSNRSLAPLLANRHLEPKLVALKRDEIALRDESMQLKPGRMAGAMVCGAIALGIGAVTFFPI